MKKAVLLNDTSVSRHLGCQLVVSQIKTLAAQNNIEIINTCPVGKHWRSIESDLLAADFCIVNGEGTIHHQAKAGLVLAEAASFCKKHGKPSFLINSICHDNGPEINRHLSDFSAIYVRESLSRNYLSSVGIESTVVPDLTLYQNIESDSIQPARAGFFFTDSVYKDVSRDIFSLAFSSGYADRFLPIQPVVRTIEKNMGAGKFFRSVKKKLKFEAGKFFILKSANLPGLKDRYSLAFKRALFQDVDLEKFLRELVACQLFLTGRYHGVCLALLTRTPFVAVSSNTFKIEGMLRDIGLQGRVFEKVTALENFLANPQPFTNEEISRIDKYLLHAKDMTDKMFTRIGQAVR